MIEHQRMHGEPVQEAERLIAHGLVRSAFAPLRGLVRSVLPAQAQAVPCEENDLGCLFENLRFDFCLPAYQKDCSLFTPRDEAMKN